jgi:hypothetical protein
MNVPLGIRPTKCYCDKFTTYTIPMALPWALDISPLRGYGPIARHWCRSSVRIQPRRGALIGAHGNAVGWRCGSLTMDVKPARCAIPWRIPMALPRANAPLRAKDRRTDQFAAPTPHLAPEGRNNQSPRQRRGWGRGALTMDVKPARCAIPWRIPMALPRPLDNPPLRGYGPIDKPWCRSSVRI